MTTYLIEADNATTAQTISSTFRKPLKLLQDFQFFRNNMSSKVSVSSPMKTSASTNRQKRGESACQLKESQSKSRSNLTSRQTSATKNSTNYRSTCKSPSSHKKQDSQNDTKSKISESSDGSVNSVGSLTSSPKWSHIKNKFENGETSPNSKTSKTSMPTNESKKSVQTSKTTKSAASNENSSFIHRNKYLSAKKDIDKKNDASANKSDNSPSSSKSGTDKSKLSSLSNKNETHKLKTKNASPKNSLLNIPAANSSALHSNSSKKFSGSTLSGFRNSQSSNSASPEGSVKNSRCSSPNSVCSSSPTSKSFPTKSSLSNISVDNFVNTSVKSTSNVSNSSSNAVRNLHSSNISNLNASYLSKRNSQNSSESKINSSFRGKQKFEDKPILSFNSTSVPCDKPEINDSNKVIKKLGTGLEKPLTSTLNTNKTSKAPKIKVNPVINNSNNKTNVSENVEKIKDLAKNSGPGQKTIWIKDTAGNWIKKADAEAKTTSHSKVASLRNKFIESNNEVNIPLTKSSTTSSVPSKHISNSRPLAKSSTTSSICDKVFLGDINKKISCIKDKASKNDASSDTEASKNSDSIVTDKKESQDDKTDSDGLKLSIVQRAVLSYEGNLALLSPETQRRLKLVSEKVQAQTDDDKILRSKTKTNLSNSTKTCPEKSDANSAKSSTNVLKAQNSLGAPVLPVRNFLSRYQQMSKSVPSKEQNKSVDEDCKIKTNPRQNETKSSFCTDIPSKNSSKKETKNSQLSSDGTNNVPKKIDQCSNNNKSVTKLTMNFKLPNGQIDMKSNDQENEYALQPNSSFLWRRTEIAPSELSKSSTASSVSLTSSDYRNYYDIENYYSSLELEIEKGSENSEEHIYIDSQESNSSENNYASSRSSTSAYQNIPKGKFQSSKFLYFLPIFKFSLQI